MLWFVTRMKNRRWLFSVGLMLGVAATLSAATPPAKPNFIIILADDLGYGDVGPFGSKLNRTPRLDRMAQQGMKLTSFYAAPVCTPSRAQMMSGCYAKRVSLPNVIFPSCPIGLNTNEATLPRLLHQQGYATMAIGKWHLGDQREFLPTRHGFDHYFGLPYSNDMGPAEEKAARRELQRAQAAAAGTNAPANAGTAAGTNARPAAAQAPSPTNYLGITRGRKPPLPLVRDEEVQETISPAQQDQLTARYTEEAVKFVREHQAEPFFLYLAHTAVHVPIHPGAAFRGKSRNGFFGDWVEEVDWSVGEVLDAVREMKLDSRTLVIFTSDNGPWLVMGTNAGVAGPLRGGKGSTWEGGMREPTVAWWPGQIQAGTSCDAVAANFDLLPTFVKLAGGAVPATPKRDGVDLWPLLSGASREQVHEALYYFQGNKLEAVRSGPWKLGLAGHGKGMNPGKVASETASPAARLYNLDQDIGETNDVAAAHPDVVERLQKLVAAMSDDLGTEKPGPGVRPPGRVSQHQPLLLRGTTFEPDPPETITLAKDLDKMEIGEALDHNRAPQVARRPLAITVTVEPTSPDGVIVAQGGKTTGYALHLREGKLVFTVREKQEAVAITADNTPTGRFEVEARLADGGVMTLFINGRKVAEGKAPGLLPTQPMEDFCVGHDNRQPVGDYPSGSLFKGKIEKLSVSQGGTSR